MREKLLVIGNGMASVRLCEELLQHSPKAYDITVVGAEKHVGYNRVLLSANLAGDASESELELHDRAWYGAHNIHLVSNVKAVALDAVARQVRLADGQIIAFDRLALATGSMPLMPPLPGMDLPGVLAFRDLEDVATMRELCARQAEVVVMGGGLLGLEAAYGLARRGAKVTVLHLMDRLMERQADGPAARLLRAGLARHGIRIELQAQTTRVLGDFEVEGVELSDGRTIAAKALVCAIGIRPNVALAQSAGIKVERGILVDDYMQTSQPHIYALGECAQHRGVVYGLVEPAYQQARALARHLGGDVEANYLGSLLSTHLKVSGIGLFSCGNFMGTAQSQHSVMDDPQFGAYRKLVFDGNRLIGAILVGDTSDAAWYRDMIASAADISAQRDMLIFGQDFVQAQPVPGGSGHVPAPRHAA